MFKKIFGTLGTRILNAICGFFTLWLGTNMLGAEQWGISGIVLLDVSFVLIAVEILLGSGMVYFTPKKKASTLLAISLTWSLLVIAATALLFWILSFFPEFYHNIVPEGYAGAVLGLTFMYCILNFNNNFLLGKERVKTFNILFVIQFCTQLTTMAILIFVFNIRDARAFVGSLFSGYTLSAIIGIIIIAPYFKGETIEDFKSSFIEMFRYGIVIQMSTLVHILNKRLSYFVITKFGGYNAVGIYNSGTQVSESVKLVGHSISLVQFSRISNSNDKDYSARLTLFFVKIAVVISALCMIVLCLLPTQFFCWLFGPEFGAVKLILIALAPGMVGLSANSIFSHYFSGTGAPKYNLYASLIGLAVTIASVYILVPLYGYIGAGISTSITFVIIVFYQWIVFKKDTKTRTRELLISKADCQLVAEEIKNLFKRS